MTWPLGICGPGTGHHHVYNQSVQPARCCRHRRKRRRQKEEEKGGKLRFLLWPVKNGMKKLCGNLLILILKIHISYFFEHVIFLHLSGPGPACGTDRLVCVGWTDGWTDSLVGRMVG